MNIAQKIILFLGLSIVLLFAYVPYKTIMYEWSDYNTTNKEFHGEKLIAKEWVEFHNICEPPNSVILFGEEAWADKAQGMVKPIEIIKERDYSTQLSLIGAEIAVIVLLCFLFKTKSKNLSLETGNSIQKIS
jgi:hypothetical protein